MTFPDAHTFKGFRYAELRAGDDKHDGIKHQMVFVSPDRVVFGYGRHAWWVPRHGLATNIKCCRAVLGDFLPPMRSKRSSLIFSSTMTFSSRMGRQSGLRIFISGH